METGREQKIEIITYHGWGFGSDFWDLWKKELPAAVIFKTADRGYFYDQKSPRFSEGHALKILVAHSFGVHLSSSNNIKSADIIVVFNGFENFHPREAKEKEKSGRLLEKMIQKFREHPREVLTRFWENTFYPASKIMYSNKRDFDKELLLEDLVSLGKSKFELKKLANGNPIISIDGGKDKILGSPRGKVFTNLSEKNAVYHFVKDAGHALPFTHQQDCWSFISAMIPIFSNHEQYRTTQQT